MRFPTEKVLILLLGVFLCTTANVLAQNAVDCQNALPEAERSYFNGDFERTISLLEPCLNADNYTETQAIRAYVLLGRIQFVLGETAAARNAVEGLYTLTPEYEPDAQLPPDYTAFILEVKNQMIADGAFPEVQEPEVTLPEQPEITDLANGEEDAPEAARASRKRKALFLGGGAALAVAAGAAILLSNGSDGGDTPPPTDGWPLPPTHPTGQ